MNLNPNLFLNFKQSLNRALFLGLRLSDTKILFSENLDKPRSAVVLPLKCFLPL